MAGERGCICYSKKAGGDAGKVVHNSSGQVLCKNPVPRGAVSIAITWGADDEDLDICAYWRGTEDFAVGWNHAMISQKPFYATWEGDNTGKAGTERLTNVKMDPWDYSGTPWFYIKFNFYGVSEGAGTCSVTVERNGSTIGSIQNVNCAKRTGNRAEPSDPGVVVKFYDSGDLESVEVA